MTEIAKKFMKFGVYPVFERNGKFGFYNEVGLVGGEGYESEQEAFFHLGRYCEQLNLNNSENFQNRVKPWMQVCFGEAISADKLERNHRFLEEALELVQACGCTQNEAHQLVDYTFNRPTGEPGQEVGGVMVTLAALCLANDINMHSATETELARVWTKVDAIREKQKTKPAMSPLPGAYPERKPLLDRNFQLGIFIEFFRATRHLENTLGIDWRPGAEKEAEDRYELAKKNAEEVLKNGGTNE